MDPPVLGLQMSPSQPGFLYGCWGSNSGHMTVWWHFTNWAVSLAPRLTSSSIILKPLKYNNSDPCIKYMMDTCMWCVICTHTCTHTNTHLRRTMSLGIWLVTYVDICNVLRININIDSAINDVLRSEAWIWYIYHIYIYVCVCVCVCTYGSQRSAFIYIYSVCVYERWFLWKVLKMWSSDADGNSTARFISSRTFIPSALMASAREAHMYQNRFAVLTI